MNLDELDIEVEDEDGTGYRNGTIRYKEGLVTFAVIDNRTVEFTGKHHPWVAANEDALVGEILKMV